MVAVVDGMLSRIGRTVCDSMMWLPQVYLFLPYQTINTVSLCFGPQEVQNTTWSYAVEYHWGWVSVEPPNAYRDKKNIKNSISWHSRDILGYRLTEQACALPQSVGKLL